MPDLKPKAMSVEEALADVTSLILDRAAALNEKAAYEIGRERQQLLDEAESWQAALATLKALAESEAGLRAENERFKSECLVYFRGKDGMGNCDPGCQWWPGEKEQCPWSRGGLLAENAALKEQLDAARPLLHAITHKYLIDEVDGGEDWKERVIRKALAYRASREEK